ncbi:hypothetical protein HY970_03230 [Candidatus Kaiserbacteria bacterium]|nr:hypothetical protein [Candidatus Kaiserbacteria bacterium]
MIHIQFSKEFLRELSKLPKELQEEVAEKVEAFKDRDNHHRLRVHKLHGPFIGSWSFSVNYRFRIIFIYSGNKKNDVTLITIGDHSIYE